MYDRSYFQGYKSGYVLSYRAMNFPFIWRSELSHIRKFVTGGKVLDIGCAYGYFLRVLSDTFEKYGVDLSAYAIEQAQLSHGSKIHFEVCDIEKQIPFAAQQFDLVTSFNVLEHFSDPTVVIKKHADVLKPGGFLYARFPFRNPVFCRDHFHHYRPVDEWLKLFSQHFDIVMRQYYYTFWGKLSDFSAAKKKANFIAVVLRKN